MFIFFTNIKNIMLLLYGRCRKSLDLHMKKQRSIAVRFSEKGINSNFLKTYLEWILMNMANGGNTSVPKSLNKNYVDILVNLNPIILSRMFTNGSE